TLSENTGASDQSTFVWRDLVGDGHILAKVNHVDTTQAYAQAGLMMRESLDADSPNIALLLTKSQGVAFQWRDTAAATTGVNRKSGVYGPVWLLLRRSGDTITGFYSTDGHTW